MLVYPDNSPRGLTKENITAENNHWKPDMKAYPYNMSVMAVVELDGRELHDGDYELAAFADGECLGSARLLEVNGRHIAFLTITGDHSQDLNLRLFDAKTGREWAGSEEAMIFTENAVIGSLDTPFVIHFRGDTSVDEQRETNFTIFPNPVSEKLVVESEEPIRQCEVYTMTGVLLYSISDGSERIEIQVDHLPVGAYLIRLTSDGSTQTKCFIKNNK